LIAPLLNGASHRRKVAEEAAELEVSRAQAIVGAVRMARGQLALFKKAAANQAAQEAAAVQAEAAKLQVSFGVES